MNKVKVGFIGAGSHANIVHYPSLSEMEDVEIVSICEINEERLNKTAEKYKIEKRFRNYFEMIEKVSLDAVYIIMAGDLIYTIVKNCLSSGLNVFIEKPPCITLHQIETLTNLSIKNNCKTMVGFNRRYIPLMRETKKIVERKGNIIQCVGTFYKNIKIGMSYYSSPVDILTHDAIHCVDTLRYLCGEVKQIRSIVRKFYTEIYNCFNAIIEFENGSIGILLTNWAGGTRIHSFEIHSKGISAFIDLPNNNQLKSIIYDSEKEEPTVIYGTETSNSEKFYRFYGYFDENRHFIDCIKENKIPETSFIDAFKTMELVDKIYKNTI